jgi:hypothetical protein
MIGSKDRTLLRDLAKKVAEIAALPVMAARRDLWKKHNALARGRPMILVFPEGSWRELLPDSALACEDREARGIEWQLRARLYYHEHLFDDTVIEKEWVVHKAIHHTEWGLEPKRRPSPSELGAWGFEPVLKEWKDLRKMRFPEVSVDGAATEQALAAAQDLFAGILDVKLKGIAHISFHLMQMYAMRRGLNETMMDMYDNPAMLHDAMGFLEEGHRRLIRQYTDLGLWSLNNDSTYHSSGGVGYTDELPKSGFDRRRVRPCDMWASAESQELAQVSPEMHAEFALRYEKPLLAPFALNGYGCCEDLTRKLDDVFTIPNIRRISIAPSANVDLCAPRLRDRYIFSWKPQPSCLVGRFDAELVRATLRHTIEVAKESGCVLEMILKDTHTCENHPERFTEWTRIARELVDSAA